MVLVEQASDTTLKPVPEIAMVPIVTELLLELVNVSGMVTSSAPTVTVPNDTALGEGESGGAAAKALRAPAHSSSVATLIIATLNLASGQLWRPDALPRSSRRVRQLSIPNLGATLFTTRNVGTAAPLGL
jgi:hypothetical protein